MKARIRFQLPRSQSAHLEWPRLRQRCEEQLAQRFPGRDVHVSAGAGWVSFAEIEIDSHTSLSSIEDVQTATIAQLQKVLGDKIEPYEAPGQPAIAVIGE